MGSGGEGRGGPLPSEATETGRLGVALTSRGWSESPIADLLDAVFANSSETIVVVGEDGLIQYASPGVEMLLGHDAASLLGRPAFDFLHPSELDKAARLFDARLERPGHDLGSEMRLRHTSGIWLSTFVTAVPLQAPFHGLAITMRSVAAEAEIERSLRQRITVGEFCNRLAAEFMELIDPTTVSSHIERALVDIALQTGAELVDVVLEHRDRSRVERFASWTLPGLAAGGDPLTRFVDAGSPAVERLLSHDVLTYDRTQLESLAVLVDGALPISLLSAPLTIGQHRGALRLMRVRPGPEWHDADAELARTAAGIFGRALRTARSEQLLALTYQLGPLGIAIRTWRGTLVDCNDRFLELCRIDREQAAKMTLLDLMVPEHRAVVSEELRRLHQGEIDHVATLVEVQRGDGSRFWGRLRSVTLRIPGSTEELVLSSTEDVTETHTQRLELEYSLRHDALTGAANRTGLAEFIDRSVERDGMLPTLIVADLDRFKTVNDLHGHHVGDQVLQELAERISGVIRSDDLVARLAGDEFAVAVTDIGEGAARRLADRLIDAARVPLLIDGRSILQTLSVGVVMGSAATSADDLMVSADLAMYEAKQRGRNRSVFFDEALHDQFMQRLALERELRRALDRDEFEVFFQPEMSITEGRVVGAEALLRWLHPDRGLIAAGEFIEVAEHCGLIDDLGRFALREACGRFAAIVERTGRDDLTMRVNMSAREFARAELVDLVRDALHRARLDPRRVCLEMTETALMDTPDVALRTITELNEIGVTSAIDDFGTGYSSLSYLKRFPVSCVKIDRTFVHDIVTDRDSQAIVESIVRLARSMGLDIVAEGVETTDQLDALRGLGCDRAQGFLWAPAITPDELTDLIIARTGSC